MTHDQDELVEIGAYPTEVEARLLASRLEGAGIEASVFSTVSDATGFISTSMPHGGVVVQVRRRDLDRARPIADEFNAERGDEAPAGE